MAISCPAEKKPASGERSSGIAEIPETSQIPDIPEISEMPAITGSAWDAENAARIDEAKGIPAREIPEEYAMALENWTRASKYPFNEDSINTIVYGNGRFVIGGGNGTRGSSKLAWCEIPAVNSDGTVEVPAEDEADIYLDTGQK